MSLGKIASVASEFAAGNGGYAGIQGAGPDLFYAAAASDGGFERALG